MCFFDTVHVSIGEISMCVLCILRLLAIIWKHIDNWNKDDQLTVMCQTASSKCPAGLSHSHAIVTITLCKPCFGMLTSYPLHLWPIKAHIHKTPLEAQKENWHTHGTWRTRSTKTHIFYICLSVVMFPCLLAWLVYTCSVLGCMDCTLCWLWSKSAWS